MDERGRFEKWLTNKFGVNAILRRYPDDDPDCLAGEYVDLLALDCWAAWQASLAERDARVEEMRLVLQNLVTVINSVAELDDNVTYFNGRYCGPLQNPLAEAERILAQTAPTSGWISVEDRLPEKSDEFLVVEDGEVMPADFRVELEHICESQWFTVRSFGIDGEERELHGVTHWMPLPTAPTVPAPVKEG